MSQAKTKKKPQSKLKALVGQSLKGLSAGDAVAEILFGKSGLASSGFPYIGAVAFRRLLADVPHLFLDAHRLLQALAALERVLRKQAVDPAASAGVLRVLGVMRTVVQSAAVCAPSDLWLLRHVLSAHRQAGTLAWLEAGRPIDSFEYARAHGLDPSQLRFDLSLLHSRGYLRHSPRGFRKANSPAVDAAFALPPLSAEDAADLTGDLHHILLSPPGEQPKPSLVRLYEAKLPRRPTAPSSPHWVAGGAEIELGFRLVPLILAMRMSEQTGRLLEGVDVTLALGSSSLIPAFKRCLAQAGLVGSSGRVTALGARVFARGPGPFGIIHAYHPYMRNLPALLRGKSDANWVERGANVAASQDANRRTFALANASLDRFCKDFGFHYDVFIEHAVGQGEATRQRYNANPGAAIRFFGADLEDQAIDRATEAQAAGLLPASMRFIRKADIGAPEALLTTLKGYDAPSDGAVMLVGNGFHEVRGQTNERMTEVFRGYQTAGIVLVFTEESALSDEDLRATAWNTYHAGFRYVHEISGQGLRPALDQEDDSGRYSWKTCATMGGYVVLKDYTTRTRKIYPVPRADGRNPAISVNYFCIPEALAKRLKVGRAAIL